MNKDQQKRLEELLDPTKVTIYCGLHNYFGPSKSGAEIKPTQGCGRCWTVMYLHDIANTPPDQRAERLDELEAVIHKMCELDAKGKWDYQPYRHSKIEIEKDAN